MNPRLFDREPPHNIEAERAVLGAILINSKVMPVVTGALGPDAFYVPSHQVIYDAAGMLHALGIPVDIVTITEELAQQGRLEEVGGVTAVADLTGATPTSANVLHYANIVQNSALTRRLITTCASVTAQAYDGGTDIGSLLEKAQAQLGAFKHAKKTSIERTELMEWKKVAATEPKWVVKDWLLRGTVTGCASTGGVGKSFLSLGIALQLVTGRVFWNGLHPDGVGTALLFDLENDGDSTMRRIAGFADRYQISDPVMEAGLQRLHAINTRGAFIESVPGTRDYRPSKHFTEFADYVRGCKPDLIIIDHLRRISGAADANDTAVMGYVMELLGMVASEYDCALLVLCHANKTSTGTDVGPENFRGASAIVDEARCAWVMRRNPDKVLELHRVKANHASTLEDGLGFHFVQTGVTGMVCLEHTGYMDANPNPGKNQPQWIFRCADQYRTTTAPALPPALQPEYAGGDIFDPVYEEREEDEIPFE